MGIIIAILQLILGVLVLIISANFLLKKVIDIAKKTNLPASFITLTVVALGTSLPELITSIIASIKGIPDVSLGNIVGSNIFNLLVVVGFTCSLRPFQSIFTSIKTEWIFLLLATCLLWVLGQDLNITRLDGFLFLILFCFFLYFTIKQKKNMHSQNQQADILSSSSLFTDWASLFISIGFLLGGSHLFLLGAIYLGESVGMTERIIGLTIVSVGTGLPELVTSIVAVFKKRYDISMANVIGSNIMNTLLITGLASLSMPLLISQSIMQYDYFWLVGTTIFLMILSIYLNLFQRVLGVFLLLLYGTYVYTLIL